MTQDQCPETEDMRQIKEAVGRLAVHWDTVQVFVTRNDPDADGTVNAHWGFGNWFARYGHIRMWLRAEEQCRRGVTPPDEDG